MNCPRPRLLVLASTYPRWTGDPEPSFVHDLARRLVGRFDVTVLCPHAPGARTREDMDGVHVVRYRYAPERWETLVNHGGIATNLKRAKWKYLLVPGFVLAQAWCAWRLVRRRRIDVVHAHWLVPQGLVATLLQWLSSREVPFLVTSHGADLYALKGRWLDRIKTIVAGRAAAMTVVSSAMRERLSELGVPAEKVSVQPMGVDLVGRFTPPRGEVRLQDEILFVGRLVEKKGVRHLLDAMPAVLRARPTARLRIAGFGPDEASLTSQVAALGLQDCVTFLGAVPQAELPRLYRQAALFVAPFVQAGSGDQEGLGLVLVEAVGCGCPVLAGNVPAVAEVLGEASSQMTIDPTDTGCLAERIVALLSDIHGAQAISRQLRATLLERFDWDGVSRRYSDLISSIIVPELTTSMMED